LHHGLLNRFNYSSPTSNAIFWNSKIQALP
jgi:hypothetical protein